MAADVVHLALPQLLAASDLYRLKRVYVPLGKVGGKPAWLNPTRVPKATDIACGVSGILISLNYHHAHLGLRQIDGLCYTDLRAASRLFRIDLSSLSIRVCLS